MDACVRILDDFKSQFSAINFCVLTTSVTSSLTMFLLKFFVRCFSPLSAIYDVVYGGGVHGLMDKVFKFENAGSVGKNLQVF